jgi:hypothetical protein
MYICEKDPELYSFQTTCPRVPVMVRGRGQWQGRLLKEPVVSARACYAPLLARHGLSLLPSSHRHARPWLQPSVARGRTHHGHRHSRMPLADATRARHGRRQSSREPTSRCGGPGRWRCSHLPTPNRYHLHEAATARKRLAIEAGRAGPPLADSVVLARPLVLVLASAC